MAVRRHAGPQPEGHQQRNCRQRPPPHRPAQLRHDPRTEQQRQRRAGGHVGAPQAHRRIAPRRVDQPHDQAGSRQTHQQKTQAFEGTQCEQYRGIGCPAADGTGKGQHHQAREHAAAQTEAVGPDTQHQPQQHAGQLHHGQQKPGLEQAHLQRVPQHGQRRRQLAHMQCGTDTRQYHDQFGRHPPARGCRHQAGSEWRSAARPCLGVDWRQGHATPTSNCRPVRRTCSRDAKRSVMPAM